MRAHGCSLAEQRERVCPLCGKAFVVQSYLDIHIRGVHNKVENLTCPECPASTEGVSSNPKLYSKKSLKRHMDAVHKKQQSCPICATGFVTEYDVTSHFRMVHLKYRQYRCKVDSLCNMISNQNGGLGRLYWTF